MTTARPPAVVPPSPASAPISFTRSSAVKLSLDRSMSRTIPDSGRDSFTARTVARASARPTTTRPAGMPASLSSFRNTPAAATAGRRARCFS